MSYTADPELVLQPCLLLSLGQPGIDIVDDLFRAGIRDADYAVCLSDQARLLQSPVETKLLSDRLTIFNTARELLPLLADRLVCLIVGPAARDLRVMLALTEISQQPVTYFLFIISPDDPTDDWLALLRELTKRLNRVFLVEPKHNTTLPAAQAVTTAVRALLAFLDDPAAGTDYTFPWRRGGRLVVVQTEADGPDRFRQLTDPHRHPISNEMRALLATNPALVYVHVDQWHKLRIADFALVADSLADCRSNGWFRMGSSEDASLPPQTVRISYILWLPLLS